MSFEYGFGRWVQTMCLGVQMIMGYENEVTDKSKIIACLDNSAQVCEFVQVQYKVHREIELFSLLHKKG